MKENIKTVFHRKFDAVKAFFSRFVTTPQPKLTCPKSAPCRTAFRVCAFVLWLLFPLFCFLSGEYICFIRPSESLLSQSALSHTADLFLNNLPVVLLVLGALYIISLIVSFFAKRLWISCAVIGLMSFCFSVASFFKYQVTGEYFYPLDLLQAGNTGLLVDYINTDIPPSIVIIGVILMLSVVFIALSRISVPLKWNIRVPAALIVTLALFLTYAVPENAAALVEHADMSFDELSDGVKNTSENGFYGALALGLLSEAASVPDEYSEATVNGILSRYEYTEAGESFTKPNVIVILQESFWDLRELPNCEFSENLLECYDEITSRDGVYSGQMLSPTFGGGTVHPEFELLTGLTSAYLPSGSIPYQFVDAPLESYPSLLKSLGYKTLAVHPYLSSFYERDETYPLLGFDDTLFIEDLEEIDSLELVRRGDFVSDDSFVDCLEYFIDQSEEPLFLFGISMESHQPYESKFKSDELTVSANCDLDDELTNILTQYAQCLYDADRSLGRLADYVDSLEEDTILVVFGDHAPSLGSDKAVYRQTGFISEEGLTEDDTERILKTPFFIMTNFESAESTMLEVGKSNLISPYNLLNAALELADAPETKLMAFLKDYAEVCPAYSVKLKGKYKASAESCIMSHKFLSYDRLRGDGYSLSDE